jgi:hypothetical protein
MEERNRTEKEETNKKVMESRKKLRKETKMKQENKVTNICSFCLFFVYLMMLSIAQQYYSVI